MKTAATLFNQLKALAAPADALVNTLTFTQGFGDVEDEERFVTLHVASDYQHYNERVEYHADKFTSEDQDLLNLLGVELSMPLGEFLAKLAAIPSVRLPKLQALQKLLKQ